MAWVLISDDHDDDCPTKQVVPFTNSVGHSVPDDLLRRHDLVGLGLGLTWPSPIPRPSGFRPRSGPVGVCHDAENASDLEPIGPPF